MGDAKFVIGLSQILCLMHMIAYEYKKNEQQTLVLLYVNGNRNFFLTFHIDDFYSRGSS